MKRKTLDLLLTSGGAMLTIVLIAAGALLLWGYNFTNNEVHNQLARQEIFFPSAKTINTKHSENYISRSVQLPYAGKQVLTGAEAKAYAYKVQMDVYPMPFHGVYAKISAYAMAHPKTAKMAALVTTSFRAVTLQGLLLQAYAFSVFGTLALDGALAAFCAAFVLLVLTGLGLWHVRKVPVEEEFPHTGSVSTAKAA
jgi:uncharacterized iron-regulated membrane protein